MSGPDYLVPFDPSAPARLLTGGAHNRRHSETVLHLGGEDEPSRPEVRVRTWNDCGPRCPVNSPMATHKAGRRVSVWVPCEAYPHCTTCDCLPGHEIVLTDEQAASLKAMLP